MSTEILDWLVNPLEPLFLPGSADLEQFEERVAEIVTPGMTKDERLVWMSRTALRKLITPTDFYGPVKNIALTATPDAYDRLVDARERGLQFGNGHGKEYGVPRPKITDSSIQLARDVTQGFSVNAELHNIKYEVIGSIDTEIWYVPVGDRVRSRGGDVPAMKRYVATPTISGPPVTEFQDQPFHKTVSAETYLNGSLSRVDPFSHRNRKFVP